MGLSTKEIETVSWSNMIKSFSSMTGFKIYMITWNLACMHYALIVSIEHNLICEKLIKIYKWELNELNKSLDRLIMAQS